MHQQQIASQVCHELVLSKATSAVSCKASSLQDSDSSGGLGCTFAMSGFDAARKRLPGRLRKYS